MRVLVFKDEPDRIAGSLDILQGGNPHLDTASAEIPEQALENGVILAARFQFDRVFTKVRKCAVLEDRVGQAFRIDGRIQKGMGLPVNPVPLFAVRVGVQDFQSIELKIGDRFVCGGIAIKRHQL